jgi:hypothetical protein
VDVLWFAVDQFRIQYFIAEVLVWNVPTQLVFIAFKGMVLWAV